jgi:hypothetical protein
MKPSNFISLEMQTGTEKLAEALLLRGFPVEVKKDMITLRNGSQEDFRQLKSFLETLNIPVFWNENRFQLLINHLPFQKMKEMIYFHGKEHFVHMEPYHFQWRSFVNRRFGIRTNTINLCPFTAIMVKALNEAGIVTLTGCNGHGNHSPNFQLSGAYNGIWFSIAQQQYMKGLSLNYHWKIQFPAEGSNAGIIATKRPEERWEMSKVLADCHQMAQVLTSHAAEIRGWKNRSFKRNMKQIAENLRLTGNYKQLFEWMKKTAEAFEESN